VPFRSAAQIRGRKLRPPPSAPVGEGVALDRAVDRCPLEAAAAAAAAATGSAAASSVSGAAGGDDLDEDDEAYGCEIGTLGNFKKSKVRSSSCSCCGFAHVVVSILWHNLNIRSRPSKVHLSCSSKDVLFLPCCYLLYMSV
jgi:hypothetical protein